MSRIGGEADKLGNQYEAIWTVECVLEVFEGHFRTITVEGHGEDSLGVEFYLKGDDDRIQFHSLKRQKVGGDWSIADLCRTDKKTNRSILGDLFEKRNKYPNVELRFVSSTGANNLRELTERAKASEKYRDFSESLSGRLISEFERLKPIFDNNLENAFTALNSLEVILHSQNDLKRSVERRISGLFNSIDGSTLQPENVRLFLFEYIGNNLGREIDKKDIGTFLNSKGIGMQNWKVDRTIRESVEKANNRYFVITEAELINSTHIIRDSVKKIVDSVLSSDSRGAIVVAPGGYGKSCVLAQCVKELASRNVAYLCLRLDSFDSCQTSKQLGEQMELRESPAIVLAGISDNQSCVLVVDQLDALSLVSGRKPAMWQVFQELLEEVRCYPKMKLILACRDFDLEHDHRLRDLGDIKSGYSKFVLIKLTEAEIRASLAVAGLEDRVLNSKQLEILGIPFHLLLFLQGEPDKNFDSVGELYDRYWIRKQQNLRMALGRDLHWNEVVDALTNYMSERQQLFAPAIVVDNWLSDAIAMTSEHVLVESQNRRQYRFFHESFFDYAYARRFCVSGQGIGALLESSEQHLFRRAQVRQILAYRRESDFEQYLLDVRWIFSYPKVRFHLKRMVASEFSRIDNPTKEEWQLIEPLLLNGELSRALSSAIRDHVGWFDILNKLSIFQKLAFFRQ